MPRNARIALRLTTLVLGISLVVLVLGGALSYVLQTARERAPETDYVVGVSDIERAALWLYLKYRGDDVNRQVNPGDDSTITFLIEPGESVASVAYRLEDTGLIEDADLFRRLLQFHGVDREIEAGAFTLRRDMTMPEIMSELQHGRVPSSLVTIPEGWRMEQVAALLEKEEVTSAVDFLKACELGRTDYPFLTDRPEGSPQHLEGFLFPDTYSLPKGTSPQVVLDVMLANWNERAAEEVMAKAEALGMSVYEIVTLASIVEREARVDEERPLIASVYLNRLRLGMPLEADPTVQYAKNAPDSEGNWWPPLTREELTTVESPYNTYLHPGLPPGPICSPGLASIKAVLEPADTEYLYFLHKGDGTHAFAKTFEEHLANEAKYPDRQ